MVRETKLQETSTRKKVDKILENLGWIVDEEDENCNVTTEVPKLIKQRKKLNRDEGDYFLYESGTDNIIGIIETKRPNESIRQALNQGVKKYAEPLGVPVVFATDGNLIRTWHIKTKSELKKDEITISSILSEKELLKFQEESDLFTPIEVKYTKQELIKIFKRANDLLRKDGLREGIERFSEFANLLFMKMISEIENEREGTNLPRRLDKRYCWDYFKDWDGQRILDYINDTILPKLADKYNHSGDVFERKIKIKNPDTIKEIVERLSKLNLSTIETDIKGEAFEYFLKESVSIGNDLGEYFTPRHIVKLIVKLVDPKFGDKIYDPCCGTGGFLIEAYKNLWNKCKHTKENIEKLQEHTIYGRELTGTARIAKMNMILAGDGHTNIKQIDSLSQPIKNKFEVILTNFPFSQRTDYGHLYGFNTDDANAVFIKHIIDALEDGGIAGVVTFQGVLYDNKKIYNDLREYLLKNCEVLAIIKLNNFVFQPYTGVNTSIIIFKKGKPTKKVWFFNVEEDGFKKTASKKGRKPIDKNDLKTLEEIWETKENTKNSWTVDISDIEKNGYNLNTDSYKPAKNRVKSKNKSTQILDVTNIIKDKVMEFDGEKNYLTTRGVKNNFVINFDKVTYKNKPSRANLLVKERDVIFSKMKDSNKSLLINKETKDLIISTGFIVLRSKDEKVIDSEFLKYIISSKRFLEERDRLAHGSTQKAINEIHDMNKITIPLPSIEMQKNILNKLNGHKKVLEKAHEFEASIFKAGIDDSYFEEGEEITLKEICKDSQYGTSEKADAKEIEGIPILRMNNLTYEGELNLDDLKYIHFSKGDKNKFLLKEGDILFNRTNSQELVGKTALFNISKEFVFASYLIRVRIDNKKALPEYVVYYMNSNKIKKKLFSMAKASVNMANINAREMLSIPIQLPSLEKQREVVSALEIQFKTLHMLKKLKLNSEKIIEKEINSLW